MNCPDHETLSAFFDGEAPEARDHVAACSKCRAFLDDLTAIRAAVVGARPALGPAWSGVGSRTPGVGVRSGSPAIGAFPPTPGFRRATPPRHRLPVFAFALLLLVLLAIPAVLLLHPRNRNEGGAFSMYDPGGRAVIYLRGRE